MKSAVCPPLAEGVLRCYSMRYCPFAQRVHIVLAAKKIKHEVVWVNLRNKPSWLMEKNPLAKVPILEQDNKLMYESLITCDYLDEVFPDPPLYPEDPWKKGQDKMYIELFSQVLRPMLKLFFNQGNKEIIEKSYEKMMTFMDVFEKELSRRNTKFFFGENPGMLDYMIWPWAERLELAHKIMKQDILLPAERHPNMISWVKNMLEDEPVAATFLPTEAHAEYFLGDPFSMEKSKL